MLEATVTSKGQVTIPIDIRSMLGVEAGDLLRFIPHDNGEVTIKRRKNYSLEALVSAFPKTTHQCTDRQIKQSIAASRNEEYHNKAVSGKKRKPRDGSHPA